MKLFRRLLAVGTIGGIALLSACADETASQPSGANLSINIAPVTYNGATDVCYGFAVVNGSGQTVVFKDDICSVDYGNGQGGDLAYVTPCDASPNNANSTVYLWLKKIVTGAGTESEADYINPCGLQRYDIDSDNDGSSDVDGADANSDTGDYPGSGDQNYDGFKCSKPVVCRENSDVAVNFKLTVMRDAFQGFFDIAVDFEDFFCSAKVDQCYTNGNHISLLLDQDADTSTPRDDTAVLALACSAGPDKAGAGGDITTTLHYSQMGIVCDHYVDTVNQGIGIPLDPTGEGNESTLQAVNLTTGAAITLAQAVNYAVYWGTEQITCGVDASNNNKPLSCNKKYWNIAVNLEDLEELGLKNCHLKANATVTGSSDANQLVNGVFVGDGVVSAGITWDEEITDANNQSTCDWNPLEGANSSNVADSSATQSAYWGTGDVIGLKPMPTMCYNKNTWDSEGNPTGRPQYTNFKDRYNFVGDDYDRNFVGKLPRAGSMQIGGNYAKGCFKFVPVFNKEEAIELALPTGGAIVAFSLAADRPNGLTDAEVAALDATAVSVSGYNGTGWIPVNIGAAGQIALSNAKQFQADLTGYSRAVLKLKTDYTGESINVSYDASEFTAQP